MKFTTKISSIIAPGFFLVCLLTQPTFPITEKTITYQQDSTTNFKNPERGIRDELTKGATLRRKYFELGAYKGTDGLPQSVFNEVNEVCSQAREEGIKIIARFRYYEQNGSDAPLDRILKHIEQLGPVLRANNDMIAIYEAGFIGCWGEWHHFMSKDVNNLDNTAARKAILFKLMDVTEKNRMIIIRYNNYKRQIFETDLPLPLDSAFSGSYRARTGAQNDCFRFNTADRGTYDQPPYTETIEFQKKFLHEDNKYVAQMGESCGASSLSACDSAMKDLKRMHWDCLNCKHFLSQWASGGCLNKILCNFGYRISLKTAQMPDSVRPGYNFNATINLQNLGWGKIYNARGCELVFKSKSKKFFVKLENDPRYWCVKEDTLVTVKIAAPIPKDIPDDTYKVYLFLPDLSARLRDRKEYSIQLANNNVWEDSTGYNSLMHEVIVSKNASVPIVKTDKAASRKLELVSVKRQNGSIEFTLPGNSVTPITLDIFSLSGAKVWSRTVLPREGNAGAVKWTGGSSGVYMWKATAEKGLSPLASGVIRSLLVSGN